MIDVGEIVSNILLFNFQDHHCPWLNTVGIKTIVVLFSSLVHMVLSYIDRIYLNIQCVGWNNHAYFTSFLAFSVLGCIQSTFILGASIYRGIHYSW